MAGRQTVEDRVANAGNVNAAIGGVIRKYLESKGYTLPGPKNYENIAMCLQWYQNDVPSFHGYRVYNGVDFCTVQRERLGMAKTCCEDHANLLINEKFQVTAKQFQKELDDIFERNAFFDNAPRLVELAYALGTGAFVAFKDEQGAPIIDYVHADMCFPIAWTSREITECAFASRTVIGKKPLFYVQIHRRAVSETGIVGNYQIENVYLNESGGVYTFKDDAKKPNVLPVVDTGSPNPLFWFVRPNTVNNVDLYSPLGLSVYSNAFSQLRSLDLVFDSYVNEFVLGKKRVMVPMAMSTIEMQKDGTMEPRFDTNDAVFYTYQNDGDKNELKEINMTLRSTEHDSGLQKMLDLFSKKVGLGTGYYKFENGVVRTATEVISTGSDLYRNRQKNIKLLTNAIKGLVNGLYFLTGKQGEIDVTIDFDDSIIEDATATANKNILLVGAGLRSKLRAIMEIEKCTEAEAKKLLAEIEKENSIDPNDDPALNGDAPNDPNGQEPPQQGDASDDPNTSTDNAQGKEGGV